MPTPRSRAFTLIEVLVVISIIAVLIGLLLPALIAAQRSSEYTRCIHNMAGFGKASITYANDNQGYMVHPNWGPASGGWLYDQRDAGGSFVTPGSIAAYDDRVRLRETGRLWGYLNGEGETYHCPMDAGPFDDNNLPTRALSSYQVNGAVNAYGAKGQDTFRFDRFRPDAVLMWEVDEAGSNPFWNDGSNYPDEGISRRHVDGAPVALIDGSSSKLAQDDFYDIAYEPTANILWCTPGSSNGR